MDKKLNKPKILFLCHTCVINLMQL